MDSTHPARDLKHFPRLRRSIRRDNVADSPERAKLLHNPSSWEPPELPEVTRSAPFVPLENATRRFRHVQQRRYRASASVARARVRALADAWALSQSVPDMHLELSTLRAEEKAANSTIRWHEGRASAQASRFDTIRTCGTTRMVVTCGPCGNSLTQEPIPCRCGVVRVCKPCADHVAGKRAKRIAAARLDAILFAEERGLFTPRIHMGAWSEKMLTLTVPHVQLHDVRADSPVADALEGEGMRTTVNARIAALRLAWPRFMRALRKLILRAEGKFFAEAFRYFRFLEWTRGSDGQGHPHFHVYLLCPFIPQAELARLWANALTSVGVGRAIPLRCSRCADEGRDTLCPLGENAPHVVVDIRRLYGPTAAQLRELIKRGERRAIEDRLTVLRRPDEVTEYANGWHMGEAFDDLSDDQMLDSKRDVYIALEGRRMAQGARGFLQPRHRPHCGNCRCVAFVAHIVDACASPTEHALAPRILFPHEERPPSDAHHDCC